MTTFSPATLAAMSRRRHILWGRCTVAVLTLVAVAPIAPVIAFALLLPWEWAFIPSGTLVVPFVLPAILVYIHVAARRPERRHLAYWLLAAPLPAFLFLIGAGEEVFLLLAAILLATSVVIHLTALGLPGTKPPALRREPGAPECPACGYPCGVSARCTECGVGLGEAQP